MDQDVTKQYPITVAVDFDGVIHRYSKGWHNGKIYDEPMPGARDAIQALLLSGRRVVIYSTRCFDRTVNGKVEHNQIAEMQIWLAKHQIPFSEISVEGKPLAHVTIDDRALRFKGDWNECLTELAFILRDIQDSFPKKETDE